MSLCQKVTFFETTTRWYINDVSLDLSAVAHAVGGTCVQHGPPDRTPVDGIERIDQFVLNGSPEFATLITGTTAELSHGLLTNKDLFSRAVYVGPEGDAGLLNMLAEHKITAILHTRDRGTALHATLIALLADDRAASDRLVTVGIKVLTQVARRGGATAVIAELAHRIDGWAVLLDPHGQLIASAGAGRLHIDDASAVALGRQVRIRHQGLQVHQVGSDRELTGYLIISSRASLTSHNRDLASQSAALFDLVQRTRDPSLTERLGRDALINTLLGGGQAAKDLLQRWGVRESHLTAFSLGAKTRSVDLERLLTRWLSELGAEHVFVRETTGVHGFIHEGLTAELGSKVSSYVTPKGGRIHIGFGRTTPIDALKKSAHEARQALEQAVKTGHPVRRFEELPTVQLVLDALRGEPVSRLTALLDPLRDASGRHGDLTETLRVFLGENGAHRASALRLGIHRQTLNARLQRIERSTGLLINNAEDRAAAWLALRATAQH